MASDYASASTDLRPAADPYVVSDVQRVMQAETLKQTALTVPGFDTYKVMRRYLEALKIPNIEEVLPDPKGPNAIQSGPDVKVQVEQIKAQERKLSLETKFKLGVMKLQQEAELNKAKIVKMEADAAKALEEAGGVKAGHDIAMLQTQLGAAKAHQDGIMKSIELMMKATEGAVNYDNNAAGVLGLGGESSDQGTQESTPQR